MTEFFVDTPQGKVDLRTGKLVDQVSTPVPANGTQRNIWEHPQFQQMYYNQLKQTTPYQVQVAGGGYGTGKMDLYKSYQTYMSNKPKPYVNPNQSQFVYVLNPQGKPYLVDSKIATQVQGDKQYSVVTSPAGQEQWQPTGNYALVQGLQTGQPGVANSPYEVVNSDHTYWENPQTVARFYNLLQTAPSQLPPWVNTKQITEAYDYLKFRNNGKPWQEWSYLNPADPGNSMLKSMEMPPTEFLLPNESNYAQPKLGNWNDLELYQQAWYTAFGGGQPMQGRPESSRVTASVLQGLVSGLATGAAISATPLTPFVGVPVGILIGLGNAYSAYTGERVPVISEMNDLLNVGRNAVENSIGVGKQLFDGDVAFQETTHNLLAAWEASKSTYETGYGIGNASMDALATAFGDSRPKGYVWRWDLGLSEAQPLEGGVQGADALSEMRQRIMSGENPADVTMDFNNRFGIQGSSNDLVMGYLLDPMNALPYLSNKGVSMWADITNDPFMKQAALKTQGNFLVDAMPFPINMIVQKASGGKFKSSGGALKAIEQYKNFIETGALLTIPDSEMPSNSALNKMVGKKLPVDYENLGYVNRWVLGLDESGSPKAYDPYNPNFFKDPAGYLTQLKPESKALGMAGNVGENVSIRIADLKSLEELDATFTKITNSTNGLAELNRAVAERLGTVDAPPLSSEAFGGTISTAVAKSLQDWYKNTYPDVTMDFRNPVNQKIIGEISEISLRLKMKPTDMLVALAKGDDIVSLITKSAEGATLPKGMEGFTNQDLMNRFTPWMKGTDSLPISFDELKVRVMNSVSDYTKDFVVNRFGIKPGGIMSKTFTALKYVQGLAVLGFNVRYLAYNVINNFVTRIYEGYDGVLTPKMIDTILAERNVPFVELPPGYIKPDDAEVTGFMKVVKDVKSKFTDKIAFATRMSKYMENAERRSVFTQAYIKNFDDSWVQASKMPKDIYDGLVARGIDPEAILYAVTAAGKSGDFSKILSGDVPVDLNQVAKKVTQFYADKFQLTPKDSLILDDLVQKTGVIHDIESKIALGVEPLTAVNQSLNGIDDYLYKAFHDEVGNVRAPDMENLVKSGALDEALKQNAITNLNALKERMTHMEEWDNIQALLGTLDKKKRQGLIASQRKIDANRFASLLQMDVESQTGILRGLGIDPNSPAGLAYLQKFQNISDNFGKAYADNQLAQDVIFDNAKATPEDWANYKTESNNRMILAFQNEIGELSTMGDAFKGALAEAGVKFTPELKSSIDNAFGQQATYRQQMQEAITKHVKEVQGLSGIEKRATWSAFVQETYNPMLAKIMSDNPAGMSKIGAEYQAVGMYQLGHDMLYPVVRDIGNEYVTQSKMGRVVNLKGAEDILPKLDAWNRKLASDHNSLKYTSVRFAKDQVNNILLDYNKRTGFDSALQWVAPYAFWYTHSVFNWMQRSMNKPALLGAYLRFRDAQQAHGVPGMPSRLAGKLRIALPGLPEWMGGGIYVDPLQQLYPPAALMQNIQQMMQADQNAVQSIEYELTTMVRNGEISQTQMDEAVKTKEGTVYNTAVTRAEANNDLSNPADLASMMVTPAMWITTPWKFLTGKKDTIPLTPFSKTFQSLAGATGIDVLGAPAKIETWMREQTGMTQAVAKYGSFGDYYVDRQIQNMIADGTVGVQPGLKAMSDHSGQIYQDAIKRVDQEVALKSPMSLPIIQAQNGAPPAAIVAGIFYSLFPDGILPQGELILRNDKLEYDHARDLHDQGDNSALTKFYDDHPEYAARTALFAKPEERLQQFLIGNIFDKYNSLNTADRKLAVGELGKEFQDTFLGGTDPSVIDVNTLALWAKIIGGLVPQLPQFETPEIQAAVPASQWSPETSAAYQKYVDERDKLFPNYYAITQAYYNEGKTLPDLQKYFDWNTQYKAEHPEISAVLAFNKASFQQASQSLENAPSELTSQLQQYFLLGYPLSSGAWSALDKLWRNNGMPDGSVENWLKVLKGQFK